MGQHSGRRAERRPSAWPRLLGLALGATGTVVAWGYLVSAAITFGVLGRAGEGRAWALMALAGTGAAACLFVGLILVGRFRREVAARPGPRPRGGGRRAAR